MAFEALNLYIFSHSVIIHSPFKDIIIIAYGNIMSAMLTLNLTQLIVAH